MKMHKFLIIVGLLLTLFVTDVLAVSHRPEHAPEQLAQARESLTLNQAKWTQITHEQVQQYNKISVDELVKLIADAKLTVTRAQLAAESAKLNFNATKDRVARLEVLKKQYEDKVLIRTGDVQENKNALLKTQKELEHAQELLKIQQENWDVTEQILSFEQNYYQALLEVNHSKTAEQKDRITQVTIKHLREIEKQWDERTVSIKKQLLNMEQSSSDSSALRQMSAIKLLQAEEQKQIIALQINLLESKPAIDEMISAPLSRDIQLQKQFFEQLNHHIETYRKHNYLIDSKTSLLRQYENIAQESHQQGLFTTTQYQEQSKRLNDLLENYRTLKSEVLDIYQKLVKYNANLKSHASKITARQQLPDSLADWRELSLILLDMPNLIVKLLQKDLALLQAKFLQASPWQHVLLSFAVVLLALSCVRLYFLLRAVLSNNTSAKDLFAQRAVYFVSEVLAKRKVSMSLFYFVLTIVSIWLIYDELLRVPFTIVCVWFVFRLMNNIARTVLLENVEDREGKDASLFYALRWAFIIAAFLTAIIVFSHQLSLPTDVSNFIDRSFMLVLLAISFPLLKNSEVLPEIMAPYIGHRPYLNRMVRLVSFLFPLTVFSNAALGLIGYVNLAWRIGIIEGQLTLIFCAWLLLRGLLGDLLQASSEFAITKVRNGWLWAQSILKPLHTVINFGLFLGAIYLAALCFGFDAESKLSKKIWHWFITPFYAGETVVISAQNIVQFFIILAVVVWAAKWSREFSYRWLFNKIRDSAVRDSLSVFTQYSTVVFGFFVMLNVLGIDITTITVLAATLSIGIAFGVRDIVSNMMSGLIMLVERPVRKGDMIEVNEFTGMVTNIGLRAITVKTGDNMDVILPNNEAIVKPFVNWTHEDKVIRNTFKIRVAFSDSPKRIQAHCLQTLAEHDQVLKSPVPQVLLVDILDDALLFEIRYHMELGSHKGRYEVHSDVMIALWDSLQTAGIQMPYPAHTVKLQREIK